LTLRVAHLLRKSDPAEWGGTEASVLGLCDGLRGEAVESVVFAPALKCEGSDPFEAAGHAVRRFQAMVPVWGLSPAARARLTCLGGNLMSFDLPLRLAAEPGLGLVHAHTGKRLGALARQVARLRRLPFVITLHGGVLDLPEGARQGLVDPLRGGLEWGRVFGALAGSRTLVRDADLVIALNEVEAGLLRQAHPGTRVEVVPHGVDTWPFRQDRRAEVARAWPDLAGRPFVLLPGRLDAVKNQAWLVEQWPQVQQRHPGLTLVLAGPCTDVAYGEVLRRTVESLGLGGAVLLVGGLPPLDPRLVGLFQSASLMVLPSLAETFGLVIMEAWASGLPVLASATSGARGLVRPGENGLLFDLAAPADFHSGLDALLGVEELRLRCVRGGRLLADSVYDGAAVARRVRGLYDELIEAGRA
jgi:glycosyltransferase involved in cell wall biosynthesis